MPYVVLARHADHRSRRASRNQKASAAVQAMRFMAEGCTEVVIVDLDGARHTLDEFREKYLPPVRPPRGRRSP